MGGGTFIRSQPANFARKLNLAFRLVKILLKTICSRKRLYTKDKKERTHTLDHSSHTYSNLSQEEKPQSNQQRQPRRAARRETLTLKQSQLRAQETRSTAIEGNRGGEKRGKTHTQAENEKHSKANKGDRGRHTGNTLRKTEMKRVTNDLTDTAIGSPLALEKAATAPRLKTFKKQR